MQTPALISYRDSKTYSSDALALQAWVTLAEGMSLRVACAAPFDPGRFSRALELCRRLTCKEEGLARIVLACAAAGVALVVVPNIQGCHVNSASKWLVPGRRALIALSIRYRREDHLYFSLFREAGAILAACQDKSHTERAEAAEKIQKDADASANSASSVLKPVFSPDEFARDFLIPPQHAPHLCEIGAIEGRGAMSSAIRRLAAELEIAPGLVVGRLQHDGLIPWNYQNDLVRQVKMEAVLLGARAAEETWPDQHSATQAVMREQGLADPVARERLRRAQASGKLLTNGQQRKAMRFEPGTLAAWRLKERDRDLDAEDREEEVA